MSLISSLDTITVAVVAKIPEWLKQFLIVLAEIYVEAEIDQRMAVS